MKNLVLGSACWAEKDKTYNFIKSLRNCYTGDVYLIVNNNLNQDTEIFFKKNKIKTILTHIKGKKIQKERFKIFLDFLNKSSYKKIFITDTRDVIFQSNPFENNKIDKLNFFLEDNIIEKCEHNSRWIKKLYGKKIYEDIKFNQISCSGTTLGNRNEIINYLKRMVHHMNNYKYISIFNYPHDQGWHNFIVHKEKFLKNKTFDNNAGIVATLSQSKVDDFIFSDFLKNKNGDIFNVIHQYDRKKFFNLMHDIIKNLIN